MNIDFHGKTIVITGAGGFIGGASAKLFASLGAQLVVSDISSEALEPILSDLSADNQMVVPAPADLEDINQVEGIVDLAIDHFGKIDVLFNNAGGMFPTPMEQVDRQAYEKVRNVNLDAIYHASRKALPFMLEEGAGVIINTTSGAGSGAVHGLAAYGAAKAGVNALTRSIAIEYGKRGIRCNAIAPSAAAPMMLEYLDTLPGGRDSWIAAQPMGRIGSAEEIAHVAAFLASDFASFINGAIIPVDGGVEALLATPQ